jgi:hypothetical protein
MGRVRDWLDAPAEDSTTIATFRHDPAALAPTFNFSKVHTAATRSVDTLGEAERPILDARLSAEPAVAVVNPAPRPLMFSDSNAALLAARGTSSTHWGPVPAASC